MARRIFRKRKFRRRFTGRRKRTGRTGYKTFKRNILKFAENKFVDS